MAIRWNIIKDECVKIGGELSPLSIFMSPSWDRKIILPYFVPHDYRHFRNVEGIASGLAPLFNVGRNSFERALIGCSTWLHDIGMAAWALSIDDLSIHVDELLKDLKGSRIGDFKRELLESSMFFKGCLNEDNCRGSACNVADLGTVYISKACMNRSIDYRLRLLRFVRAYHPWISESYVEHKLPKDVTLIRELGGGAARFSSLVGEICKLHDNKVELRNRVSTFEGYEVDTAKYGALLRIADALDFNRSRVENIFDVIRNDMVNDGFFYVLKHWVFKYAVKGVDANSGGVTVEISDEAEESMVLGFLLFEVGDNLAEDYETVNLYRRLPNIVIINGGKDLTLNKYISELRFAYRKLGELKDADRLGRYGKELNRIGVEEEQVNAIISSFNDAKLKGLMNPPLDALALALTLGKNASGLADLIAQDLPSDVRSHVGELFIPR
ncbi:HD domain-containing protein [Thermocladium modestius]|nr:hypothetical protein [Thermocladium modestius]